MLLLVAMQEAAQAEPVLTSYYGEELAGNPTASGEPFNPYGLTAAHPYLPFGTSLTVTSNGRSVNVRVNDRGPFVAGRGLDLSVGAARAIGLTSSGVAVVDVEVAKAPGVKAPVPDGETTEPAGSGKTTEPVKPTGTISAAKADPLAEVPEAEQQPLRFPAGRLTSFTKQIVDTTGKDFSLRSYIDAPFETPPSPDASLAMMGVGGKEIGNMPYARPVVLRRRRDEPGEGVV
jgi:rare lipoprotein A